MVESAEFLGSDLLKQLTLSPEEKEIPQPVVLLVDDRPENIVALKAVLEPVGATFLVAHSGEEALRLLLKNDVALILMDAQMPGMDGFETTEMIRRRERNRSVPIIFLTAYSTDPRYLFQGYSVGAVDFIAKPFNPDILCSKVKVFVELYRQNELIKLQGKKLIESEKRDIERQRAEMAREFERESIKAINRQLEERVAERTAELLQVNEQLEAFCYSISHDLRAPLRAISSTSHILLEDAGQKLNSKERHELERQAAAANRLALLIDNLLALARLTRRNLDTQNVDITGLAKDAAQSALHHEWPAPIEINVHDGMRAECDPQMVAILLQNLVENACKYSPNGGRIEIGQKLEDDRRSFFVSDEGVGFEMKYAHKIFQPFERLVLENEFPGTGIGLASAQRVVNRHRGEIWVESEPGVGSTFYFTLG